ncbi:MAG TPA: beta-ketoacyl synthase chain length factor [Burkholderiales bacterium]|nr:beta-ketoacyl synthase chain length factor [Burkholderiales bacterium]
MTQAYLGSVGVIGPGIPDWHTARAVLRGECEYKAGPAPEPDAAVLPANERRRAAATVRWALAVAQQATSAGGCRPDDVATVFASSGSDGETLHRICEALAGAEREISPTRFHNSVHNAAAGYWTIAAGSRKPSVSVCGYDASFAVGLVEAVSQVHAEGVPVLLVAYDLPYPQPLYAVRPFEYPLAVALLLAPEPVPGTLARLRVEVAPEASACTPFPAALPAAFADTPAGRSLALLASVARGGRESVRLGYLDGCQLVVDAVTWS